MFDFSVRKPTGQVHMQCDSLIFVQDYRLYRFVVGRIEMDGKNDDLLLLDMSDRYSNHKYHSVARHSFDTEQVLHFRPLDQFAISIFLTLFVRQHISEHHQFYPAGISI